MSGLTEKNKANPINSPEQKTELAPCFQAKSLAILVESYGSFDVGIQNFKAHNTPVELKLATIEGFSTIN